MYVVSWKNLRGQACLREFDSLSPALEWAQTLGQFVSISGNDSVIVGKFGVDSVTEGLLPCGSAYQWRKRR